MFFSFKSKCITKTCDTKQENIWIQFFSVWMDSSCLFNVRCQAVIEHHHLLPLIGASQLECLVLCCSRIQIQIRSMATSHIQAQRAHAGTAASGNAKWVRVPAQALDLLCICLTNCFTVCVSHVTIRQESFSSSVCLVSYFSQIWC